MQDQVDALLLAGVRAAFLNSSQDFNSVVDTERRLMRGELDLIYVAPERLLTDRFIGLLDQLVERDQLALFAIDEAHCVSQWGHDFRPEYIQLSKLHERYPQVPRIALTATADELTRQEIISRLGLDTARIFVSSFDRPNIRYTIVERDNPRRQLLAFLADHRGAAGIVYCLSRRKVDETAAWLCEQGIAALPYHAGLNAGMRQQHQQRFLREDGIVMVATIAFGMGIDKPDVRFVAHLDLPKSLEAYYQETGRAGRDGEPSEGWMTYGLNDVVIHRQMIEESPSPVEQKRVERQKLDAMLAYCESARCRRVVLLNYFGEEAAPCGN
jgi:ATP-dependent DNA helicase RecQ